MFRISHINLGLRRTYIPLIVIAFMLPRHLVQGTWLDNVATQSIALLDALVPMLLAIAFAVFVWGIVVFIYAAADEKAREAGKSRIVWGLVALFVMITVWGIVQLMQAMLGADAPPVLHAPTATITP